MPMRSKRAATDAKSLDLLIRRSENLRFVRLPEHEAVEESLTNLSLGFPPAALQDIPSIRMSLA